MVQDHYIKFGQKILRIQFDYFWVVKSSKIDILPLKNNHIELKYLKNNLPVFYDMSVSLTHKNPLGLSQLSYSSSWTKYPGVLKFGYGRDVLQCN